VTSSGSFDVGGQVWKSAFGKLLQSLPIPAFLVDKSRRIMVMNQASARISPGYEKAIGKNFRTLCADPETAKCVLKVLGDVFTTRKTQAVEAILQIGDNKFAARLTFRSIRLLDERLLLVMVEDLTAEKRELALLKKHEEELRRAYGELEDRVTERTAALRNANHALKKLISGIQEKDNNSIAKLRRDLKLRVTPLLGLLKAEAASERVKMISQAVELSIKSVFEADSAAWLPFALQLTPRENQVCELVRSGLTTKQIAEVLRVSADAVQTHRGNIRKKLGLERSQGSLSAWLQSYPDQRDILPHL
jgi:DNA-binding CsgD family transcriptional regulator